MTVGELLKILKPMRPELEVRLAELMDEQTGELRYPHLTEVEYDEKVAEVPVVVLY